MPERQRHRLGQNETGCPRVGDDPQCGTADALSVRPTAAMLTEHDDIGSDLVGD